jgi:hypothetical protein
MRIGRRVFMKGSPKIHSLKVYFHSSDKYYMVCDRATRSLVHEFLGGICGVSFWFFWRFLSPLQ